MSVKEPDAKDYIKLIKNVVDAFAEMAERLGNNEKETGIIFDPDMFREPDIINTLIRNSSEEDLGKFMKLLLRLATVGQDMQNIMKLTPDKKIELAKNLKELMSSNVE